MNDFDYLKLKLTFSDLILLLMNKNLYDKRSAGILRNP